MSNYTKDWFDVRGLKTWDKLLEGRDIKTALEVGCYEGKASTFLLEKFPELYLVVIDIFYDDVTEAEDYAGYEPDYEKRFDENTAPYKDRVEKIKSDSYFGLAMEIVEEAKYDLIYIDGDHRTFPAFRDCMMAWELLRPGGIMIIDDFDEIPEVNWMANAFIGVLPEGTYKEYTTEDGEQLVIERI